MKLPKKYEEMSKEIVRLIEEKEKREGVKYTLAFDDDVKPKKQNKKPTRNARPAASQ